MQRQRIHDARTFVRPNFNYQLTQTDHFAGITQLMSCDLRKAVGGGYSWLT